MIITVHYNIVHIVIFGCVIYDVPLVNKYNVIINNTWHIPMCEYKSQRNPLVTSQRFETIMFQFCYCSECPPVNSESSLDIRPI